MTWHPDECRAWEERAEEYVEGDAELAVGEVASEHEAFIAVQAMLMAPHDELLQSLLIQEARIAVWQIDPTRLRADNVRYIRRAIITAERAAFWREFRDSGGKKRDGIRAIEMSEESPLPLGLRPDLAARHVDKAEGWLEQRPRPRRKLKPEVLTPAQVLYRMERDKRRRSDAA
jgi:hypothetical protein